MSIKLSWTLPEGVALDKVVVYRDTKRISTAALPAPLIELAADAVAHEDSTVTSGSIYYYIIALVKGEQVSFSSNYEMGYFATTGPGPQMLMRGTWECGYFGYLTDTEFFSYSDIKDQLALPWGVSWQAGGWFKMIYKGKIIFYPAVAYTNVTWQQLYAAGLIYGDDTTGDFITGMTPPNPLRKQDARVTRDGFDFRVRIPKVVDHKKAYQAYASYEGTEIADLFDLLYSDINAEYGDGKERLHYEAPGKMNFMTSGFYNTSYVNVVNTHKGTTYTALSTPYTWRPVLELIL